MYMPRPKTVEEYVKLVDQAIIEVDEMIACMEYESEDGGAQSRFLDPVLASLQDIRAAMADGSYIFEDKDLSFMGVANQLGNSLPFSELLAVINVTHRKGLDVGE